MSRDYKQCYCSQRSPKTDATDFDSSVKIQNSPGCSVTRYTILFSIIIVVVVRVGESCCSGVLMFENGEYVRDIIFFLFYVVCQRENIVEEWKAIHKSGRRKKRERERERDFRFEQKFVEKGNF